MASIQNSIFLTPMIDKPQIDLLESLSNASGISGEEGEVRTIILEQVKPYSDDVNVDALGNVLVTRHAQVDHPLRVMVAAHMDEVGFMIVDSEDGNLFRFETVGSIDTRWMAGKAVLVGKDHIPAVIGAQPIHLIEEEEMTHSISLNSLRIDAGPDGSKIKPGDRAVFATRFHQAGPSLMGKALDNRMGVTLLIELVKHAPGNIELLAAFTVQEEVGLRGARVAGYLMNPDLAVVMDSTPANDLPAWDDTENTKYNTRLDGGPAIHIADRATISDPRLVQHLMRTGDENHIPFQIRQPGGGGTDAGVIHTQREGIPSVSVSVPGRYAHSPMMVARLNDWKNTLTLVHTALLHIPADILKQ